MSFLMTSPMKSAPNLVLLDGVIWIGCDRAGTSTLPKTTGTMNQTEGTCYLPAFRWGYRQEDFMNTYSKPLGHCNAGTCHMSPPIA